MKKKTAYQYPWRSNNTFQVLVDGAEFFPAMLDEIKKAKQFILLEHYLFESGKAANEFITELCRAREKGIKVFVLLDEYGSKGLNIQDKDKLINSGIQLLLYHPTSIFHFSKSLKRDHRKLLIADNKVSFIGGAGITDEFSSELSNDYWHDVMLKIEGDVVSDLTHSFQKIWNKYKTPHLNLISKKQTATDKKNKARVLIAEGAERNEIIRAIIKQIRSSKNRVWLTSPYFISSWKIRRALRDAAKKGIDVRLIFPGEHSDHNWITHGIRRYYQRLLKANAAVYEFQPRFTHSKIILCDDWFTIGSSNLDRWNQFLNLDANIEVYNEQAYQQITKVFKADFAKSSLIILNQWSTRSFLQQSKEWISGIAINFLGFISRKFKR